VSEKRPIAKELLNHPFILEKARGCALISELVSNSIDEINKYRIERFNPDNDSELEEEEDNDSSKQDNGCGTVINNEESNDYATMLVNSGTVKNNGTSQINTMKNNAKDNEKSGAPEFMKYINEMDISYDEFKLETDLYQHMEKRKKGNDEDLRALKLMEDENDISMGNQNNGTITADKQSVSSENSKSVIKRKNRYSDQSNNLVENPKTRYIHNSTSNFSELPDKKQYDERANNEENPYNVKINFHSNGEERVSSSKEFTGSTMKMNLNKPLLIYPQNLLKKVGKLGSNELLELLEDNDLKLMGIGILEENLKKTYSSIEREIELIREKYQNKIKKYNTALEFLRSNPHLKNLKEYEDYSKFSKLLDQTKFSAYSNNEEGSIGGSSFLPLNNVKVHKYKDNNINAKNK
jgi:hypothetical protein